MNYGTSSVVRYRFCQFQSDDVTTNFRKLAFYYSFFLPSIAICNTVYNRYISEAARFFYLNLLFLSFLQLSFSRSFLQHKF